jgi:O-antigen/teichoic acid export membrane protein
MREEIRDNPGIVTFALILFGTSLTQPLAYLMARYAVLSHFGEAQAGLLQSAIALAASLGLVLNPANGLYLTPILNRDIPKEDKLRAALEFQRKLMIVLGLLAVPIVLFAPWLLILLYSRAFVEASGVVFLFVMAQCVTQMAGVYQALIIGLDDLKIYGLIVGVGQLSLGVISWGLAPRYGLLGVALGFLCASVIIFLVTLIQLSVRHRLALPFRLRAVMAYGLLALLGAEGLVAWFDGPSPLVIVGKVGFYGLFVLGSWFFLEQAERQEVVRRGKALLVRADPRHWPYTLGDAYHRLSRILFGKVG